MGKNYTEKPDKNRLVSVVIVIRIHFLNRFHFFGFKSRFSRYSDVVVLKWLLRFLNRFFYFVFFGSDIQFCQTSTINFLIPDSSGMIIKFYSYINCRKTCNMYLNVSIFEIHRIHLMLKFK